MYYIVNSFSVNMLTALISAANERGEDITAKFASVDAEVVRDFLYGENYVSVVGHLDTSVLLEKELGIPVAFNRQSLTVGTGDSLIVGQYVGPRLPEGTKVLPEGAEIQWLIVTFGSVSQ